MALDIRHRPRAKVDLVDIWRYIAGDDDAAADRLLDRVYATLRMLADHPEAGRARPELHESLRSFPVGNYIIYYECTPNALTVIRVLSAFRDISDEMVR
ncbi:type II toxin-antitoxin system RelE/ParE family toxin [Rhizobium sp. 32-5/1]|uniref:type II toxin-antitoxin system RelE/ParE family toxin n=1 Tax=Rhizobium sp. 32-5/1 TaxID=3019602 RepID=UPI00240D7536|nr:type II toxin-antitoxin system RelE/ParE family toxin [Rhizobium sp. 32-5/1]WEZ82884.1 type II toxin-antitoxin system RelE/ParE family toxin [Rhizobium sp. 32-5/1]